MLNRIVIDYWNARNSNMLGYRRKDLLADGGLIAVAFFTTFLLRYTLLFEDYLLSLFFRCMLYLIDVSIFTAVVISLEGQGAIMVFYAFRLV